MTRAIQQSSFRFNSVITRCLTMGIITAGLTAMGCKKSSDRPAPEATATEDTVVEANPHADAEDMRNFLNSTRGADSAGGMAEGLPSGHPPIPRAGPGVMPTDLPLLYQVPKSWVTETPKSSMRKAQYRLPGAAGDGDMVLFFFGKGQGGTVEANIERWAGQFSTPDGEPIPESGRVVDTMEVAGMTVTTLDVAGRYRSAMPMPGDSGPTDATRRMLAAIIETPGGMWFFKGTGPVDTMGEHQAAFKDLIASMGWKGE